MRRPRTRFTLRRIMIAVAVVAIALAPLTNRLRRDDRAPPTPFDHIVDICIGFQAGIVVIVPVSLLSIVVVRLLAWAVEQRNDES